MNLQDYNRNGTLSIRLDDGRVGKVYTSGYVRVSVLAGNSNFSTLIYSEKPANAAKARYYQINSTTRTWRPGMHPQSGEVRRTLTKSFEEGLQLLLKFNNKNCSEKAIKARTLRFCEEVFKHAKRKNNIA